MEGINPCESMATLELQRHHAVPPPPQKTMRFQIVKLRVFRVPPPPRFYHSRVTVFILRGIWASVRLTPYCSMPFKGSCSHQRSAQLANLWELEFSSFFLFGCKIQM